MVEILLVFVTVVLLIGTLSCLDIHQFYFSFGSERLDKA